MKKKCEIAIKIFKKVHFLAVKNLIGTNKKIVIQIVFLNNI